ncbi:MAG: hypothetical protein HY302_05420 [Opitutae bacterium]|nr:hypothetical protein [Opitutae bacterium]
MYSLGIFSKDRVVKLTDVPQSSIGAPCPMVVAEEGCTTVVFYLENASANWDGRTVRVVEPESTEDSYAVVTFSLTGAHYFGAPNDEAFAGHPLAKKGLRPYGAFEITDSTWMKLSVKRNRVHPHHREEAYFGLKHFVLSFHNSIFECLARSYKIETARGSIHSAARALMENRKNASH